MPKQGHNGKSMYLPWEAYAIVGQAKYKRAYPPFTSGPVLPHQEKPESEEYERRQRRSFRSHEIVTALLDALYVGKSVGWFFQDGNWVEVPFDDWQCDSIAKNQLLADLAAYYEGNGRSSDRLQIEADGLDSYFLPGKKPKLAQWKKPSLRSRGHPGIPKAWAIAELLRMENAGELDAEVGDNSRKKACAALIEQYRLTDQGITTKVESLERQLRPTFRVIEQERRSKRK